MPHHILNLIYYMAVQQTNCYQLVTIGYLKELIKDGDDSLIKDSTGANKFVPSSYADTYCPTYTELTNGSILPKRVTATSPTGDTDGIIVNEYFYGSDNPSSPTKYATNQCVDRKDLSLGYTRYTAFSVSASPTEISECGGSSTLSYSNGFVRWTKSMNTSCNIVSSSASVTDASATITWSTSDFGTINGNIFTVGKNGSVSADSRTTTITGKMNFMGEHSDSVDITQKALGGSFDGNVYSSKTEVTSIEVLPTTATQFGCAGGTYGIKGTEYSDGYTMYYWKDSCGVSYTNVRTDWIRTSIGTVTWTDTKTGSFQAVEPDCELDYNASATLSFPRGGDTIEFTQYCPADPTQEKCQGPCTTFIVDKGTINASAAGGDGGCDSCYFGELGQYVNIDGTVRDGKLTPVFTFSDGTTSTTCSWVSIKFWNWQDYPDFIKMCSHYGYYPFVAQKLMIAAYGDAAKSTPEGPAGCTASTSSSNLCIKDGIIQCVRDASNQCVDGRVNPGLSVYPQMVQDAINNVGDYARSLGSIEYIISPNTSTSSRGVQVAFMVDNIECKSATFDINQAGSGGDDCSTKIRSVTASCVSSSGGYMQIGRYKLEGTTCSGSWSVLETPSWINNVTFTNEDAGDGYKYIYGTVNSNGPTQRTGTVRVNYSGAGNDRFDVIQCAGSATYYTYTVLSNVEGAKVKFNSTTLYITNGAATLVTTENTTYNVTISKTNCTFPTSTTTISANQTKTLNGSCAAPVCTCSDVTVTMSMNTIAGKGYTGGTGSIGQYGISNPSGCELNPVVSLCSSANWISNLSLAPTPPSTTSGYILATVNRNESTSSRAACIGIKVNGSSGSYCKQVNVTQLPANRVSVTLENRSGASVTGQLRIFNSGNVILTYNITSSIAHNASTTFTLFTDDKVGKTIDRAQFITTQGGCRECGGSGIGKALTNNASITLVITSTTC